MNRDTKLHKDEKRLLEAFSDQSMAIDRKFKAKLRNNITKASRGKARRRWSLPKLILVPAPALMLVMVTFAGLQKPEEGESPFRPQAVSAAELIQRAEEVAKQHQLDDGNFWFEESTSKSGPRTLKCDGSVPDVYIPNDTFQTYTYSNKQVGVQARFTVLTKEGQSMVLSEVYNDTGLDVLGESGIRPSSGSSSLSLWLGQAQEGGKGDAKNHVNDLFVRQDGMLVQSTAIEQSLQNNVPVYEFFVKPKKELERISGCEPVIEQFVIDAKTYRLIKRAAYDATGKIAPQYLVSEFTYRYEAATLDVADAMARLKAAGFDKSLATDRVSDKYARPLPDTKPRGTIE